jgi:hypothetical protein
MIGIRRNTELISIHGLIFDVNNSNFGQITGMQEKLDTTCKQNAS